MTKTLTIKKTKDVLRNLRKLTPANPKIDDDLEISIKEAISFIAPDLIQMTRRVFTIKELSAGLAVDGIDINPGTLKRYLNEYLWCQKKVQKNPKQLLKPTVSAMINRSRAMNPAIPTDPTVTVGRQNAKRQRLLKIPIWTRKIINLLQ